MPSADDSAARVVSLVEHRAARETPPPDPPSVPFVLDVKERRIAHRGLRKARRALDEAVKKAADEDE